MRCAFVRAVRETGAGGRGRAGLGAVPGRQPNSRRDVAAYWTAPPGTDCPVPVLPRRAGPGVVGQPLHREPVGVMVGVGAPVPSPDGVHDVTAVVDPVDVVEPGVPRRAAPRQGEVVLVLVSRSRGTKRAARGRGGVGMKGERRGG